jgi:hypothetical protein
MSASNTTLRLLTVLFILAGILLLRKPVFGQTVTATPRFSVVVPGVAPAKGADVILIPGLSNSREAHAAEATPLAPNYPLHLIWIVIFAGAPAAFDKAVQSFLKPPAQPINYSRLRQSPCIES